MSEPPVTKYELTVKIRGNTHDEIEDELRTLVHGGYLLDSDYGKRDAWNATGGRCTSVMVHTNPEQTPEAYAAELDAYTTTWWNERRLVEDAPEPEDPDADLIRVMSDAIGGSASWADDARSALAALREAGYSVTRDRDAQEAGR